MKRTGIPVLFVAAFAMAEPVAGNQVQTGTPSTAAIPGWTALQEACFSYVERKRAEDPEKGPDRWTGLQCRLPQDPLGERAVLQLGRDVNESGPDEGVPRKLFGCMVEAVHEAGRVGPREYLKPYDASHPVFENLEYDVRRLYRRVLRAARETCEARFVASEAGRAFLASGAALAAFGGLGIAWFAVGQRRSVTAAAQARRAIMAELKGIDRRTTPSVFFVDKESSDGTAQRMALAVAGDRVVLAPLDGGSVASMANEDLSVYIIESRDQACRLAMAAQRGRTSARVRFNGAVDLVRFANLLIGKRITLSYRREV